MSLPRSEWTAATSTTFSTLGDVVASPGLELQLSGGGLKRAPECRSFVGAAGFGGEPPDGRAVLPVCRGRADTPIAAPCHARAHVSAVECAGSSLLGE